MQPQTVRNKIIYKVLTHLGVGGGCFGRILVLP